MEARFDCFEGFLGSMRKTKRDTNSQQYRDLQCIMGRIRPIRLSNTVTHVNDVQGDHV